MMLGRFLEISVYAPDVVESLAFYEALGFVQAVTGDMWTHPYAVVTDGRLFLGLHQYRFASPALTWVQPDLAERLEPLRHEGLQFEFERCGEDVFNEAGFLDPGGQMVTLLEARTFSPPDLPVSHTSACGDFSEYGMPARSFEATRDFWEALGFVGIEAEGSAFPRLTLTSDHLNIGLYRSRALRGPVLTFEAPDMGQRIDALRERGFALGDAMPDGLDDASNATLSAPEGTQLLLLESGG
jgi:catechol 2,3-dioxygenase-like lactoylglutathione lyase family enzyme